MRVISSIDEIKSTKKLAITIGNFDGVHLGHQVFLRQIKSECEKKDRIFVVVTFIPHPLQILAPSDNYLINRYQDRRELLKEQEVDFLLEIDFDRDLSMLAPNDFLKKYILAGPKISDLYMGHDFSLGKDKSGNHEYVEDYCNKHHINVHLQQKFRFKEQDINSTTIRKLLGDGKIEMANELLDRQFFISGRIIKGEGRGRKLGYRTANLKMAPSMIAPSAGVYITKINYNDEMYYSITNIGYRPTFANYKEATIESYILDFEGDIYGEDIILTFVQKLRNEKKFKSGDELVEQIRKDIEKVKGYFDL